MLSSLWFRKAKGMFVCKQHTYICLCSFTWTAFDVLGCNLVLWVWFCEIRFWKSWFPLAFYQTHPSNSILLNLLNSLLPFICDMGGLSCCLGGYTEMSLNNGWGTGRGMFCCTKVRLDDCYQRNDKFLSFKKKKKTSRKTLLWNLVRSLTTTSFLANIPSSGISVLFENCWTMQ